MNSIAQWRERWGKAIGKESNLTSPLITRLSGYYFIYPDWFIQHKANLHVITKLQAPHYWKMKTHFCIQSLSSLWWIQTSASLRKVSITIPSPDTSQYLAGSSPLMWPVLGKLKLGERRFKSSDEWNAYEIRNVIEKRWFPLWNGYTHSETNFSSKK